MFRRPGIVLLLLVWPGTLLAQEPWRFRGTWELGADWYAERPSLRDARVVGSSRLNVSLQRQRQPWGGFFLSADLEIDSHHDVARTRFIDWNERGLRRPLLAAREAYWEKRFGMADLRIGRQQLRWGRADGFNPTDNLEPFDFLDPFRERRHAPTAVKGDLYLGATRLELAWVPLFAPSRMSLLGQRWFPRLPAALELQGQPVPVSFTDGRRRFPSTRDALAQFGGRWNVSLPRGDFSFSYFDGFDDLPFFSPQLAGGRPAGILLHREYHRRRIAGLDFATSLGRAGLRGEAAYHGRRDVGDDAYLSYVVGADYQRGNLWTIVEFTAHWVARRGSLPQPTSFDRGLSRAVLLRTRYERGVAHSLELVALVRLPAGDSAWRVLYTRKLADAWELELRAALFAGRRSAFLGQFRDNNGGGLRLRYRW